MQKKTIKLSMTADNVPEQPPRGSPERHRPGFVTMGQDGRRYQVVLDKTTQRHIWLVTKKKLSVPTRRVTRRVTKKAHTTSRRARSRKVKPRPSGRQAPRESANWHGICTARRGLDGKMWHVAPVFTRAGKNYHQWRRGNGRGKSYCAFKGKFLPVALDFQRGQP